MATVKNKECVRHLQWLPTTPHCVVLVRTWSMRVVVAIQKNTPNILISCSNLDLMMLTRFERWHIAGSILLHDDSQNPRNSCSQTNLWEQNTPSLTKNCGGQKKKYAELPKPVFSEPKPIRLGNKPSVMCLNPVAINPSFSVLGFSDPLKPSANRESG